MSVLRLSISKFLEGESSLAIGELLDRDGRSVRHLLIPVGKKPVPLEVNDLQPGPYLVRVVLPSGQRLERQVHVSDKEDSLVRLDAHGSMREWLSWHHFATAAADVGSRSRGALGFSRFQTFGRGASSTVFDLEVHVLDGDGLRRQPLRIGGDDDFGFGLMRCEVSTYVDGPVLSIRFLSEVQDPSMCPRVFLYVRRGRLRQIVTVPTPWYAQTPTSDNGVDHGHQRMVEVMLALPEAQSRRFRNPSAPKLVTSVVVRDPVFGAALPFLAAGEIESARQIIGEVEQLQDVQDLAAQWLYNKRSNPLAAAAGGYVLARSAAREVSQDWIAWTRNLMNWFPWLPDGAILHGWFQLTVSGDPDTALQCFQQAVTRGPPVFTEGLRLLSDGLLRLSRWQGTPSEETERLSRRTREFAIAADPRQVFTTYYGKNPNEPQPPPPPFRRVLPGFRRP